MIELQDVCLAYNTKEAVRNFSYSFKDGSTTALIGSNGSGKTSLLKSIAGLLTITNGKIYLNKKIIKGPEDSLIPGHPEIKLLTQESKIKANMTVKENIDCCFKGERKNFIQKRTAELLKLINLEEKQDLPVETLSGGQRQKLALIRSIVYPPKVLLLDEPFNQVDFIESIRLFDHIKDLQNVYGMIVIFTSHQLDLIRLYSENILVLREGKLYRNDSYQNLYNHPRDHYTAGLTGLYSNINDKIYRPHQIKICKTSSFSGKILACIFTQYMYVVKIQHNEQIFYAKSKKALSPGTEVSFDVNK